MSFNRIHIIGAAGSGTSTLGQALARELPHVHLDTDTYYWLDSDVFTKKRDVPERLALMKEDFAKHPDWVLTGSLCGWGDELMPYFDLVIFLYIPPAIRLERLRQRELERYGDAVLPGGSRYEHACAFYDWASQYDTAGPELRSKVMHERWMSQLACPVLRIEGDHTVEERIARTLDFLRKMG